MQLDAELGAADLGDDSSIAWQVPEQRAGKRRRGLRGLRHPGHGQSLRVAPTSHPSFFDNNPETHSLGCFDVTCREYRRRSAGRWQLAAGRARVVSRLTLEPTDLAFAALSPGDHNVSCGLSRDMPEGAFAAALDALGPAFERGDLTEVNRLLAERFGPQLYSVWHLFKDEQRAVMTRIMQPAVAEAEEAAADTGVQLPCELPAWLACPRRPRSARAGKVVNAELARLFMARMWTWTSVPALEEARSGPCVDRVRLLPGLGLPQHQDGRGRPGRGRCPEALGLVVAVWSGYPAGLT
jgi:hypothetical protein